MDLTNEILKFSSILQEQADSPLRDGLKFFIIDEALSPSIYNDNESTTTVDGVDLTSTYRSTSKREFDDEVEPGTPSSQATVSIKIPVEGWPAQQKELGMELERLSMWKFDVRDQGVDTRFSDHGNPLHTIIRRSLVNIAHVLIELLKPELTTPGSHLDGAYSKLRKQLEQCRDSIQSNPFDGDGRPYPQTRSRQSSFGASSDDFDVLGTLRDNIDRLGYVLSGLLVKNSAPKSLGKRLRRKSSLEGGDHKVDRKKLYNGPQSLSQLPEELEDSLVPLEQSISDIKSLWDATTTLLDLHPHRAASTENATTTLNLCDKVGKVSTILEYTVSHGSDITNLRSASSVALGELGLITAEKNFLNGEPNSTFQEPGDSCSGGHLRTLTNVLRVGEVLSQLPAWSIHTSTETSGLVNIVATAIWLSLLQELLVSLQNILQNILQHLIESNTTAFCLDHDQMAQLQRVFEEYSQCHTRSRLESLIAIRRSTTGLLKKLHQSASNCIRSLCEFSESLMQATAWSPPNEEYGHVLTVDVDTGTLEPKSSQTSSVKPPFPSPVQSFTICITQDAHGDPLCQKRLDDFLS